MEIGDLVLCGSEETLGIIIGWDEDKDPIGRKRQKEEKEVDKEARHQA